MVFPVVMYGCEGWSVKKAEDGRTDAEAETPILLPPHEKCWLIGKVSNAGRDWGQEEKGTTEIEMAGWHHQLDGHEFEWTPGVGDGQGCLACCDSWGCRVGHDWATELNWTELMDLTFQVPKQYCSLRHQTCFYHQSHPQLGVVFALAPSLHSF